MSTLRRWLASGPVAGLLALLTWVLMVSTGSLPSMSRELLEVVGTGPGQLAAGRYWTLVTNGWFAINWGAAVWATLLLLSVGVWTERRLGHWQFLTVGLATQVAGCLAGTLTADVLHGPFAGWGHNLVGHLDVGITAWLVGSAMAASSRLDTLDRRRVRAGLGTLVVVLTLFAGHLQDLNRLFAALVGLLIGSVIWQRHAPHRSLTGTRRAGRELIALVVAAVAAATILTVFTPGSIGPLAPVANIFRDIPFSRADLPAICADPNLAHECRLGTYRLRTAGVAPAIGLLLPQWMLLVLAAGLRRGRRAAWGGAVLINTVFAALATFALISAVAQGPSLGGDRHYLGLLPSGLPGARLVLPVVVPASLIGLLVAGRRLFTIRAPQGTNRRLATWVGGSTVGAMALVVVAGMTMTDSFSPTATIGLVASDFLVRVLPAATLTMLPPTLIPLTDAAEFVVEWLPILPWFVLLVVWLRSFSATQLVQTSAPRRQMKELLHSPGGSSVAWCGTWEGNNYWFSSTTDAGVAWRPVGGVALTVGDPACRPEGLATAVSEFADYCSQQGLIPAFYSVQQATADATTALGWANVKVAEETVLDLATLEFKGKRFQDVRTALHKADKDGIAARWFSYAKCPLSLRDQIGVISEEWVADKGLPEMGFTLGGVDQLDDPEVRLLLAVDENGTLHGVTSWMPVYREGKLVGLTLDFMRRRSAGFRPVMEFLIAKAAMDAKDEGLTTLSLSGVPLASPEDDTAQTDVLSTVLDWLSEALEPVYGFRSLLAFKAKVQPIYHPMYLAFPDFAELPAIGLAIGRAYVPSISLLDGVRLGSTLLRPTARSQSGPDSVTATGSET